MNEAGLSAQARRPEHFYWKYWQKRADSPGTRSYVLSEQNEILAHGAVIPGLCRWGGKSCRVLHMIDWAAKPGAVGAGVFLMKQVGKLTNILLGIGGSEDTLKIMPLIGYRAAGFVTGYVRTISPVRLFKTEVGNPDWRLIPRVTRSALWTVTAPKSDFDGWRSRRIARDEIHRIVNAVPEASPGIAVFERNVALFQYLLDCPIVPVEIYALEKAGRIGGYFVLSYAPGQARLADSWMVSDEPGDWRALINLAVSQARRRDDVAEIVTWSSETRLSNLLEKCGFHDRHRIPIYLKGARDLEPSHTSLRVQMVENDAFYLCRGTSELWA